MNEYKIGDIIYFTDAPESGYNRTEHTEYTAKIISNCSEHNEYKVNVIKCTHNGIWEKWKDPTYVHSVSPDTWRVFRLLDEDLRTPLGKFINDIYIQEKENGNLCKI